MPPTTHAANQIILPRRLPREGSVSRGGDPGGMRRTHPLPTRPDRPGDHPTGPPDDRPQAAVAAVPGQLQPLWALAVAVAESAAEIAASRPIASWRAAAYLYAAADQAWGADGNGGPGGWRTDRSGSGGEFRFAVLLAEAACARFVAGDGYLSNRQLAADLRHGAAWLATGALLTA
jgi:hypothetical protein